MCVCQLSCIGTRSIHTAKSKYEARIIFESLKNLYKMELDTVIWSKHEMK